MESLENCYCSLQLVEGASRALLQRNKICLVSCALVHQAKEAEIRELRHVIAMKVGFPVLLKQSHRRRHA